MTTIDGLSVKVSAAVSQFNAGMSRAQNAAGDLALSLRRLGMASDAAEGEVDSLGRSATTTAGQMGAFILSTDGAAFSVGGLSSVIAVSLVPALGTLLAAITPVVAALGGFVAIAGAIAGVGIIGTIGAIATNTELLKNRFSGVLNLLETAFAPVFDTATSVLLDLLNAFARIIPQMVPAQSTIGALAASFSELGVSVIEMLPAFLELATSLATEFLPPFVEFVQGVLPQVPSMVMGLVQTFRELSPMFADAANTIGELLPPLMEFGMTALPVVADALGRISNVMMQALNAVNSLSSAQGELVAQLSLLGPVLTTVISLVGGISAPVLLAIGAVAALVQAWRTNFGGMRDETSELMTAIQGLLGDRLPALISNGKSLLDSFLTTFEPIFAVMIDLMSVGVLNAVDLLLSGLTAVSQLLKGDFSGAWQTVIGVVRRTVGRIMPFIRSAIDSVVSFMANEAPGLIQGAFRALGGIVRTVLVSAFNFLFKGGFERMVITAFGKVVSYLVEDFGNDIKAAISTAIGLGKTALKTGLSIWKSVFDNIIIPAMRGFVNGLFGSDSAFGNIVDKLAVIFGKVATVTMVGMNHFRNIFADVFNWLITHFGDAFNTILSTISDGLNGIISMINNAIGVIPWDRVPGSDRPDRLGQIEAPQIDTGMRMEQVSTDREVIREQVTERIAQITVEDGEIVAKMQDEAESVVQGEQRNTRRNQGRRANPN